MKYKLVGNKTTYTNELYARMQEYYGKAIISGQEESSFLEPNEMKYIKNLTGELPVIRAMDYVYYSTGLFENDGVTERAIEWHKKGGVVSMCWHWISPMERNHFYTAKTTFDVERAVNKSTKEYQEVMKDIDTIGDELEILKKKEVPVLWRPLHESDGKWFWWGAKNGEALKELWKMMFERYNERGLDNLIWIFSASCKENFNEYCPNDDLFDMVGLDDYAKKYEYSNFDSINAMLKARFLDKKMLALSENGPLPDIHNLDKVLWSYFCTWREVFIETEDFTTDEYKKEVYHSNKVITLDKWIKNK